MQCHTERTPVSGGRSCWADASMVHCKMQYAAMQTKELRLASGIPMFALYEMQRPAVSPCGTTMSKTASLGLLPSASLFGRVMATIDRLLMAHARIAIRNGELPYPGL
jgi:hypothetical protein